MKVVVYSRSRARQQLIEQLSRFYVEQLNLDRSRKTVTIYTVPRLLKERGILGCAIRDEGNVAVLLDSRLTFSKIMITLAHEFVHVKQIALGQLRPLKKNDSSKWIWRGRVYKNNDYVSPWENEAYSREGVLAAAVMNRVAISKKKRVRS